VTTSHGRAVAGGEFRQWKPLGTPESLGTVTLPATRQPAAREVYLVDKPGAPQSQIRIGWIGVSAVDAGLLPHSDPEHDSRRIRSRRA
jgi:hypothetical protein